MEYIGAVNGWKGHVGNKERDAKGIGGLSVGYRDKDYCSGVGGGGGRGDSAGN